MSRHQLTIVFVAAVGLIAFGMADRASAWPDSSASCSNCHGSPQDGMMEAAPGQTMMTFGGTTLPTYTTTPGSAVDLMMDVLDGAEKYAAVLKDLDSGGTNNPANMLDYTGDSSWFDQAGYFTEGDDNGHNGLEFQGATVPLTFNMGVGAGTPLDVYQLTFAVATGDSAERRYDEGSFFLNVVPEPSSLTLLAVGLGAIGFVGRRRRRRSA